MKTCTPAVYYCGCFLTCGVCNFFSPSSSSLFSCDLLYPLFFSSLCVFLSWPILRHFSFVTPQAHYAPPFLCRSSFSLSLSISANRAVMRPKDHHTRTNSIIKQKTNRLNLLVLVVFILSIYLSIYLIDKCTNLKIQMTIIDDDSEAR